MFWEKGYKTGAERLDRLGRELTEAGGMSAEESEAATASPLVYARLRARIASEQRRRATAVNKTGVSNWFQTLPAARRAIPVMLMIAAAAVGTSWVTGGPPRGAGLQPARPRATVNACAITSAEVLAVDACAISTDQVLAVIVNRSEQEAQR